MSEQSNHLRRISVTHRSACGFDDATTGEVSRLFGLTHRAIRFYEERGLIAPRRDQLNRRCFGCEDRRRLQIISLLRGAGLRLEEVQAVFESKAEDAKRLSTAFLASRVERLQRELKAARIALDQFKSSDVF